MSKQQHEPVFADNLGTTPYFNTDHSSVIAYAEKALSEQGVSSESPSIDIAKALYLKVRDDIRYNAYTFDKREESFSASYCLEKGQSYCIPKAVLLGTLCRLYNIPTRLGLADVRNHMASQQFVDYLKSDVFVMHGYTDIFLEGKWVKATPAFDRGLCELMNLNPLEFNGRDDSIFHEYDRSGEKHMEYIQDHGVFADVPHALILDSVAKAYPHLAKADLSQQQGHSMYDDIQNEMKTR